MRRNKRIEERVQEIGTRSVRRRRGHSQNFLNMFKFYLDIYEHGIATFCGVDVQVDFDPEGTDAKVAFKEYDNGIFIGTPFSCEPDILKKVIIGKKAWGLLINAWAMGIAEFTFTKYEFYELFKISDTVTIEIPDALLKDFHNRVEQKRALQSRLHLDYLKHVKSIMHPIKIEARLSKDTIRAKVKAQYGVLKTN